MSDFGVRAAGAASDRIENLVHVPPLPRHHPPDQL